MAAGFRDEQSRSSGDFRGAALVFSSTAITVAFRSSIDFSLCHESFALKENR